MGEKDLCLKCKKNLAGKPKDIDFLYRYLNLRFFVFKSGLECIDCRIKEHVKLFEEFGKDLIQKKSERLVVNWKLFCEKEIFRSGTYSEAVHKAMRDILISLNILSFESQSNYEIISSHGLPLTPFCIVGWLRFTRGQDAIEYAKIKHKNTLYSWEIRHIDKIIKKSDIINAGAE